MSRSGPRRAAALVLAILALGAIESRGQGSSSPPPPTRHFEDYAHLVPEAEAKRLDQKLQTFQEETSNDVIVAVYPELPEPSMEDFTVRTAQAWRTGRKGLDNGVVLFVFVKDHKLRLEVGYGLEGALPDAIAKRILEDEITPRFRSGDFVGGLEAGIDAIVKATRGEYKPAPRRVVSPVVVSPIVQLLLIVAVILLMAWLQRQAGPTVYTRDGRRTYRRSPWGGGWGAGGGGIGYGGWGGGGGSGGGGGGYSGGGGGQFGGGGASGSW